MCFSATASFTAGACLCLGGIYAVNRAVQMAPKFTPLAIYPFAFGIQQLIEGGVWVALQGGWMEMANRFALGFLLFSHGFWLFWVPFSVFWLEERPIPKQILLGLTVVGGLFGASLDLPLWLNDWVRVAIAHRHITYDVTLIYNDVIPWSLGRLFYASLVILPFALSEKKAVKVMGGLIGLSVAITAILYESIFFISVWCFFAAIISSYILYYLVRSQEMLHQSKSQLWE